jgi:hypothetical protein
MTTVQHADTHRGMVDVTNPARRPRVLMVVANPTESTTTGWPVGFWPAELFVVCGGLAPTFQFRDNADLQRAIATAYEAHEPTAQAAAAHRPGAVRVVQWICGEGAAAKHTIAQLVHDMGYAPVDLGGTETCALLEAPPRRGAVYGEEYRLPGAQGS